MDKKFVTKFIAYWVVNALVLSLLNTFFPDFYEMGNAYLSIPMAAILSGFLLTVLLYLAKSFAKTMKSAKTARITMFGYYWVSASIAIWIVARVASVSGFGETAFMWAIVAGIAVSFSNWLLRQALKGAKLV